MTEPGTIYLVLSSVNVVLLGIVGFFLRGLYSRFSDLEKDVKGSLISSAVEAQRIVQIEKDLAELKQIVMSDLFKRFSNERKA